MFHWTCPRYEPNAPLPSCCHWSQPRAGIWSNGRPSESFPGIAHGWSPFPEMLPRVQYGIPAACAGALNQPHGTIAPPSGSAISSRKYGQFSSWPFTWNVMHPWSAGLFNADAGQAPDSLTVIAAETFSGVLLYDPCNESHVELPGLRSDWPMIQPGFAVGNGRFANPSVRIIEKTTSLG